MKRMFTILFLFIFFGNFNIFSQALTGDKIIKATGGDYATLGAAITALNANGVSGTVRFLIDENLNEVGTALVITRTDLTATNNLIIKPNTGKTPTITITAFPTTGAPNHSASQGFTIDNASYITIDGSNSVGGTTRDLTISANDAAGLYLIGVTDNSDFITIKNVILTYTALGANSTAVGADGYTGVADNLVVQNCLVGSPTVAFRNGLAFWGNAVTTPMNAYAYDNIIYTKRRGITTFYNIKNIYRGNTISIVTPDANQTFYSGIYLTGFPLNDTSIIENNRIIKLTSNPTATARFSGGIVVYGNEGVLNIHNNFIAANFTNITATTNEKVYGIVFGSAGWVGTANIAYNTIEINSTNQTGRHACIGWELSSSAVLNIKNNLLINRHDNAASFGIHWPNTASPTSVLTSNYNDIFVTGAGNTGMYGINIYVALPNWQTGTTLDANSKEKNVQFVSATDLHLTGTSIGDADLTGIAVPYITTDIDGDARLVPYMGADEASLPGLAGIYYVGAPGTGPGGSNPHFNSFKAACDTLNHGTIIANCTFVITSNLVEPAHVGLGYNSNGYTVRFIPLEGTVDTIFFAQTTDNPGVSGAFVIGSPDLTVTSATNYGLVTTENLIIDGNNAIESAARNLVFVTNAGIHANSYPIRTMGDVNNVVIKNIKITTLQSTSYALVLSVRNFSSTNFVPDNITIEDCEITNTFGATAQGLAISNSGTPTAFPTGIVFKNNVITAKTRGIFLNYAGNTDVFGNEISISQTNTGYMSYGIWGYVIGDVTNITNIYNNKIKLLASANIAAGDYGVVGIQAGSKGVYNIYNNMIYGFDALATTENPNVKLFGIRNTSADVTANIYFNSIYLPNIDLVPGTGVVQYVGIYISNGINTLLNNIVASDEADFPTYCIYRAGALGTLTSDNNDFFVSNATFGNIGYFNTADAKTFADWKTASGLDANSVNVNPLYTSATDLHLLNNSSPVIGKGVAIPLFTTDIDGETRDNPPEIGADEKPGVIPVEFVSFSAAVTGNEVQLGWETATETNSAYFEVERKTVNSDWTKVGKVNAAGTTSDATTYTFTDKQVPNGKIFYRLRQVDLNGTFSFSQQVDVLVDVPATFELSQNYPNPFNPYTTIRYALPQESKVTLEVYTVLGELVANLVNNVQPAGKYSVVLDGSKLASGTYIYRLVANENVMTKKMVLIK
ncbi:MAG: T9SS type A sorting domain-containing protein [Ignavibacteriaceae bacterium]